MRTLLIITLLLSTFLINGQNFQGKATYKVHRAVSIKINDGKGGADKSLQKKLKERMKKMSEKTFTLQFNKSESIYTQNKELKPEAQTGGVQIVMFGDGGGTDILYKDVTKKIYKNKTEISGKNFLIEDALENFDWKMTSETKKIGKYTCYKATRSREEERLSFTMTDGKREETKDKVTVTTVVWYTPEIPVSTGPKLFWGLPGLILEVHEGKETIVCTELIMNSKEKLEIKKPKKGKRISQEKFNALMKKKTKEMMERFNNKRKSKSDGTTMHIEIQG